MTSVSHISPENLTEYALGTLPPTQLNSMRAHFMLCAPCREQLRQINLSLAAYGAAVAQGSVPPLARDHFVDRLAVTSQVRAIKGMPKFGSSLIIRLRTYLDWFKTGRWMVYLVGALAVGLFWSVIIDYRISTELRLMYAQARQGDLDSSRLNEILDLLTSTNMKRVELRENPMLANQPEGHITYSSQSGRLLFTGSSLHTLPIEKTYQLWVLLVGDYAPISAGTFTPDNSGNASLIPPPIPAHLTIRTFALSIEDKGGATSPTLPYQLTGE